MECGVSEAYYINLDDTKVVILDGSKFYKDKIKDNIVYITFHASYSAEGLFKNLLPEMN